MNISVKDFWYIVAESRELKSEQVLGITLLDEWVALYRDTSGKPTAVLDRCLHRNARLSKGKVKDGELVCSYHGWKYGEKGQLTAVPSERERFQAKVSKCVPSFSCVEQEGYIYVRLNPRPPESVKDLPPYSIPFISKKGYQHIRLKHVFSASVPNCAENFIDIPHTTYVHPNIFRYEAAPQQIRAEVEQEQANVHIRYLNETSNFGFFSRFLNKSGKPIFHEDHYYFPNITHVEYRFSDRMHFNITSQSVPVSATETHVYTDLTYDYGVWNLFARPIVRWVGKKIIGQDVKIMGEQSEVTRKYGECFASTRSDLHHVWIEKIYRDLLDGKDPRGNEAKKELIEFYI